MLTIFLLAILSVAVAEPCNTYSNVVDLDASIGYTLSWNIVGSKVQIALQGRNSGGWLGLGLADHGGGTMKGADLLVCTLGTEVQCIDYHGPWSAFSTAQGTPDIASIAPIQDSSNDWKIINGQTTADGSLLFELERELNTTDLQDRPIVPSGNNVLWAHGTSSFLSYHGKNRGAMSLNFFNNTTPALPAYTGTAILRANSYNIPPQRTTYMCQSFVLPSDKKRHMIAFEPIVDNPTIVHHMLLYVCSNSTMWQRFASPDLCFSGPPELQMNCQSIVYAFAHTAVPFILPADAGFPIGPGIDDDSFVIMEYHYDNPTLSSSIVDSSGVKVYYTDNVRKYDAGSLALGSVLFPDLVATGGNALVHRQSTCPSSCTTSQLSNGPVTVFASFEHMHNYGQKIQTNHYNKNGKYIETMNRVDWWDGGFQMFQFQGPPMKQLSPGDELFTHCYYDVSEAGGPIQFGPSTSDEMCLDFLMYYPKVPTFSVCGWYFENSTICGETNLYNGTDPQYAHLQLTPDPSQQALFNDPTNFGNPNYDSNKFPLTAPSGMCKNNNNGTSGGSRVDTGAKPLGNSAAVVQFGSMFGLLFICFTVLMIEGVFSY